MHVVGLFSGMSPPEQAIMSRAVPELPTLGRPGKFTMKWLAITIAFLFSSMAAAQVTVSPVPTLRYQVSNSDGILTGAYLYSCVAGSTCPGTNLLTYADSTGLIANPDPVQLDSLGSASIWVKTCTPYKFVLEDINHVLIYSVDNVQSCASGGGGGPAPPVQSIQYNSPLGSFQGSAKFTTTDSGQVLISGGGNLEIDATPTSSSNNLVSNGVQTVIDSTGANGGGFAGGIELNINDSQWPPETAALPITNIAITSNILTVTSALSGLSYRNYVVFSGLTTATFLNGQVCEVYDSSATQFRCYFAHADYPSAPDTGTAHQQRSSNPLPLYILPTVYQPGGNSIGMEIDLNTHPPLSYNAGTGTGVLVSGIGGETTYDFDGQVTSRAAQYESAIFRAENIPSALAHDYALKVEGDVQGSPYLFAYSNGDMYTRGAIRLSGNTTLGGCSLSAGLDDCTASLTAAGGGPPKSETMTLKVCTAGATNDTFAWSSNGTPSCIGQRLLPMAGGGTPQTIDDDISIAWGAATGHTVGATAAISVNVPIMAKYDQSGCTGPACPTGTVTSSGSPVSGNIPKFTTATNIAPAAASDIVNLFSGCSGTQDLGADGACHANAAAPVYSATGTAFTAPHTTIGTGTMSGGVFSLTMTGAAVFTSSATFVCTANDTTNGGNAIKVAIVSGNSVNFSAPGGGSDGIIYQCVGN